jgi:hypothetical protein
MVPFETFIELKKQNDEIMKTNEEFKHLLVEQSKQMFEQKEEFTNLFVEQTKQIFEQTAKLIEIAVQPKIDVTNTNTNTNSNNTTNNNQFNLHFFLNEQCKDAQNLDDFIADIVVDFDDIKYMDQFGYVDGMSNIIVRQFNKTDVFKRPIHCTDLKRETMYVKNDDKWTKEGPEKRNLQRIINSTYKKNQEGMRQLFKENPQLADTKNPEWDYYMRLMRASMGGLSEYEDRKFDNKVIRNLAKTVLVEK